MINHIMIGLGLLSVLIILILLFAQCESEMPCVGCGNAYLLSESDAVCQHLFHNSECESQFLRTHPAPSSSKGGQ